MNECVSGVQVDWCWEEKTEVLAENALRYKPAGCGFDSRWCHWNFSV